MADVDRPEVAGDELARPTATARQMLAEGKTLEDVWGHLRAAGYDMFDAKLVTMRVTGLSSYEAKRALFLSDTWRDLRPAIERLEDAIIEAALEMGATVKIDGQPVEAKTTG